MRSLSALALLLLSAAALLNGPAARADDALLGSWVLDAKASDDVEDAFDGKLRRLSFPTPLTGTDGGRRPPDPSRDRLEHAQAAYWDRVREREERRSLRNLHRLGTVYPLLTATRLDITASADGYLIVYDGDLPRQVRPNAAGRVFSARGDELVADTLGHTLSYREGASLVLETDPPDGGGKYFEHLDAHAVPGRLEYRVKVDLRVLEEPVEVRRVFVRPAASGR